MLNTNKMVSSPFFSFRKYLLQFSFVITEFPSEVDLVMVSLLQDQSNIKFSSSDTLERDQQEDLMKTPGDSVSPIQQTVSAIDQCCSPPPEV